MTDDERQAFVELTDRTEIAALWWAEWGDGDVWALLSRPDVGAPWELVIRTRRRVDDELHPLKTKDKKTGYRISSGAPATDADRDRLSARVQPTLGTVLALVGRPDAPITRYDINGNADDFARVWATLPFANTSILYDGPERPQ